MYAYDNANQMTLCSSSLSDGTLWYSAVYAYDVNGHLLTETTWTAPATGTSTIHFGYDGDNAWG